MTLYFYLRSDLSFDPEHLIRRVYHSRCPLRKSFVCARSTRLTLLCSGPDVTWVARP